MTTNVLNRKIGEVNNKIRHASGLVKRTHYNTKILNIEKNCFIASDYNKLASKILDEKIWRKKKELVVKYNFSYLAK